jgi:hypothetical protein
VVRMSICKHLLLYQCEVPRPPLPPLSEHPQFMAQLATLTNINVPCYLMTIVGRALTTYRAARGAAVGSEMRAALYPPF